MAEVSGPAAAAFTSHLGSPTGLEVVEAGDDRWWLRAPDHERLCDALAATPRPPGRLRIEVDPLRIEEGRYIPSAACQSSNRVPSGSSAQAKLPYSSSCTSGDTVAPTSRSRCRAAGRSSTR